MPILLVWAVVAIAAMFTAEEITSMLTNTAADKEKLVTAMDKFAKDNNLPPDAAAALLSSSFVPKGSGTEPGFFDQIKTLALWSAVGIIGFKVVLPALTQKKSSA